MNKPHNSALTYIAISLFLLLTSPNLAQSLSGVWEGTYAHFFPTCCDEHNYKLKLKVYEDARGAMWIETENRPISDNHAIGQLFAVGFRQPDGKIAIKELRLTFSSIPYINSCFKNCSWCVKEFLLTHDKQGKNETLTGLWNSKDCYPGGEVSLIKIAELADGNDIELIKLGHEEDKHFDAYRMVRKPFRFLPSDNPDEVKLALFGLYGNIPIKVNSKDDFDNESNFTLQNVTMSIKDNYQTIVYLELKDKRNSKVYPITPSNVSKNEIMNLPYSPWGLTFPNKSQWEKILATHSDKTEQTEETADSTVNESAVEQINERPIEIRNNAITFSSTAKVHIELWDSNIEDGDIISLYVNDKCVLSKYQLTKEKKSVHSLPLRKGKNIITMYAENLGDLPPNTASVSVYGNGRAKKTLILKSDMHISEAIEVVVE